MTDAATVTPFRFRDQNITNLVALAALQQADAALGPILDAIERAKAAASKGDGYALSRAVNDAKAAMTGDLKDALFDADMAASELITGETDAINPEGPGDAA